MHTFRCTAGRLLPSLLAALVWWVGLSRGGADVDFAVTPVYLDDSPAAVDLLNEAEHLLGQQRTSEAVGKYQQALEQYGRKLHPAKADLHEDLTTTVWRLLANHPALLASYRQQYEPAAQRLLAQLPAAPDARRAQLADLTTRYWLTPSGAAGALDLAAMLLEEGALEDAAGLLRALRQHPDLPAFERRYSLLAGACGLFGAEPAALEAARVRLRALHADAELAQLAQWQQQLARPQLPAVVQVGQSVADAAVPPGQLGESLWTLVLRQEGDTSHAGPRGMERPRSTLDDNLLPALVGDLLVVNDGRVVTALDAVSGRLRWRHAPREVDLRAVLGNLASANQWIADARGVAPADGELYTIVGRVSNNRFGWRLKMHHTWLSCLAQRDGVARWRVEPRQLDETLDTAFFHGTPAVDALRVYALIRRSQQSGFHSSYVIALDRRDGSLVWKRNLASTAATGSAGATLGALTLADGQLYVNDGLGAVAALNARDGAVRWLRVLGGEKPDPRRMPVVRQLWSASQLPAPLRLPAGLLVISAREAQGPLLLDPDTGVLQRVLVANWRGDDQMLLTPHGLLVYGAGLRLLDAQTLAPRWEMPAAPDEPGALAGAPCVVGEQLLLARAHELLTIDLRDGAVRQRQPLEAGGNLLLGKQQLLIADAQGLQMLMTWEQARKQLLAQVAARPDDPQPALALAHLAAQRQQWSDMLDAVDAAISAWDQTRLRQRSEELTSALQALHRELFRQVRALADPESLPDSDTRRGPYLSLLNAGAELRQALFDRLASLARTPADEVAYQLAAGRFQQASGRGGDALDHYQSVLADPQLAAQLFQHGSGARQARLEARLLITRLLEAQPELRDTYELTAQQRLTELLGDPAAGADPLVALAEQYPTAAASPAALYHAGQRLAQQGAHDRAGSLLIRAYHDAGPRAQLRGAIAGALALSCEDAGQPTRAARWLRQLQRDHPQQAPLVDGRPRSLADWLGRLGTQVVREAQLPQLTLPLDRAAALPGRLLLPRDGAPPAEIIITQAGLRLRAFEVQTLAQLWTCELPLPNVTLLRADGDQLLLYYHGEKLLEARQMRDGAPSWELVDVDALLEGVGDPQQRDQARPLAQRQFEEMLNPGNIQLLLGRAAPAPEEPPAWTAANASQVVIADPTGRVLALERASGRVLWQHFFDFTTLRQMALDEQTLLLAGDVGPENETQSGSIQVVDPATGQRVIEVVEERSPIVWVGLSGDERLIYLTNSQIAAHDVRQGQVIWRLPLSGQMPAPFVKVAGNYLVIRKDNGNLLLLDATDGRTLRTFGPSLTDGRGLMIEQVGGLWLVLSQEQALALDEQGHLLWRDALSSDYRRVISQLVAEQHVVLVSRANAPGNPVALGNPGGAAGGHPPRALGGPAVLPRDVVVEDGAMIVGPLELPQGDAAPEPTAEGYALFVLERQTGRIIAEQLLAPVEGRLIPELCVLLGGKVVMSSPSHTIVVEHAGR